MYRSRCESPLQRLTLFGEKTYPVESNTILFQCSVEVFKHRLSCDLCILPFLQVRHKVHVDHTFLFVLILVPVASHRAAIFILVFTQSLHVMEVFHKRQKLSKDNIPMLLVSTASIRDCPSCRCSSHSSFSHRRPVVEVVGPKTLDQTLDAAVNLLDVLQLGPFPF